MILHHRRRSCHLMISSPFSKSRFLRKKSLKYSLYAIGFLLSVALIAVMIYQAKDSFVKIWQTVKIQYLFLSLFSVVMIYVSMGLALYEVLCEHQSTV